TDLPERADTGARSSRSCSGISVVLRQQECRGGASGRESGPFGNGRRGLVSPQSSNLCFDHLEGGFFCCLRRYHRLIQTPFEPEAVNQGDEIAGKCRCVHHPVTHSGDRGNVLCKL